jgi:hypothetical protein
VIISAWRTEKLNLDGEVVPVALVLVSCNFEQDVILFDCTLPGLFLNGSQLPTLNAVRLRCKRNLYLQDGFRATGKVDLLGANINEQLSCRGGKFLPTMWR